MTDTATSSTVKRATRKKAEPSVPSSDVPLGESPVIQHRVKNDMFVDILALLTRAKDNYEALQKVIEETKNVWQKEQQDHARMLTERDTQEEIARKREQETYVYETAKKRRQEEDEFSQKQLAFERELSQKKEQLAKEKEELEDLRKHVAKFDAEKEKAVKEAVADKEKELTAQFSAEKKLREQEIKGEKELLVAKISYITQENTRLIQEVNTLKASLADVTRQFQAIAVKVIESSATTLSQKTPIAQEEK